MLNNPLITVIIPVYNVEQYVEECVLSVLNQSYKNLQVIIIDDGSTDNSYQKVKDIVIGDSRVKIIRQENQGLSAARNKGLTLSSGEYIAFVDSDDYIMDNYIEILYKSLVKHNGDISIVNSRHIKSGKINRYLKSNFFIRIFDKYEILEKIYSQENNYSSVLVVGQNKLYKKRLFDNTHFPIGRIYEDEFTIYKLYLKSKRIVYINRDLYVYRIRQGSILRSKYSLKNLDKIDMLEERIEILKKKNMDLFLTQRRYYFVLSKEYLCLLRYNYKEQKLGDIAKKHKYMFQDLKDKIHKKDKLKYIVLGICIPILEYLRRYIV